MKGRDYVDALEEQGYTVLLAIGFKEENENYRLKIAAATPLKRLSPVTYQSITDTIMDALDRLYDTPMDDLERCD